MLQTTPSCELCNGTGWIAGAGTFRAAPCSCQKETRKRQRLAASHVPRRYVHCTLEKFHDPGNVSIQRARREAVDFVDCWPGSNEGILLMGACGVGKTHLAVAVIQELIEQDKPGKLLFSNFQDLVQEIQASFDSSDSPRKSDILQPLLEADLLVLDELGSQKPTQWVQDILYYIINSRYNDVRTTIFTTNYYDEPPNPKEERLEERIGPRLRSRLYSMTRPVVITGANDYRKTVEGRRI